MYLHRQARDAAIEDLANRYPKAIFENPEMRRPLKVTILDDLETEGVLDRTRLAHVLDWYMSDFRYRYAVIAGAERIDLSGKKAGVVTLKEQQESRQWVLTRKKELAEQRALRDGVSPSSVVVSPPPAVKELNGHENPTMIKPPTPPARPPPNAVRVPGFETMRAAPDAVVRLLNDAGLSAPLRAAMATAALKEVIREAETMIGSLQGKEVQP